GVQLCSRLRPRIGWTLRQVLKAVVAFKVVVNGLQPFGQFLAVCFLVASLLCLQFVENCLSSRTPRVFCLARNLPLFPRLLSFFTLHSSQFTIQLLAQWL